MSYSSKLENIIEKLDEYARDYDRYEYGLPTRPEDFEKMKELISPIIKEIVGQAILKPEEYFNT